MNLAFNYSLSSSLLHWQYTEQNRPEQHSPAQHNTYKSVTCIIYNISWRKKKKTKKDERTVNIETPETAET